MKIYIFISILASFSIFAMQAQTATADLAVNNHRSDETTPPSSEHEYVYEVYDSISSSKTDFDEVHFLGGRLSAKWNTFNQIYTHVFDVKVGLSNSAVEIQKPCVYNAVIKVNNYYKKGIKKGILSKEDAIKELSHIFDCAYVICVTDNTSDFENEVKKAKSPDDIIRIFNRVKIKLMN